MCFKKQVSLFLAFFVLIANSGLAFNVHYCEGKIASISSVFSNDEVCDTPIPAEAKTCCKKQVESHKKCCSDKEVNLKNKAEKITIKSVSFNVDSLFFEPLFSYVSFISNFVDFPNQITFFQCNVHAPPLYQLYCQYTFYA